MAIMNWHGKNEKVEKKKRYIYIYYGYYDDNYY